jgi:hypothetical protein
VVEQGFVDVHVGQKSGAVDCHVGFLRESCG